MLRKRQRAAFCCRTARASSNIDAPSSYSHWACTAVGHVWLLRLTLCRNLIQRIWIKRVNKAQNNCVLCSMDCWISAEHFLGLVLHCSEIKVWALSKSGFVAKIATLLHIFKAGNVISTKKNVFLNTTHNRGNSKAVVVSDSSSRWKHCSTYMHVSHPCQSSTWQHWGNLKAGCQDYCHSPESENAWNMLSLLQFMTRPWCSVSYFFGSKVAMKFIAGRCNFHLFCFKWEILNSRFTVSPDPDLNEVIPEPWI